MDDAEVERLAEEYFERLVREDRASRSRWRPSGQVPADAPDSLDPAEFDFGMTVFTYWDELQAENERMLYGDRRSVKEDVEQAAAGRALDEDTRERLEFAFQRARMRYLKAMAREWEADFSGEPRAAAPRVPSALSAPNGNTSPNPDAKTVSQAAEAWTRRESHRWKKNTRDETARSLRWFAQVVGGEKRLDTVRREDVTRFKAVLERVPRGTPAAANVARFEHAEAPPKGKARSATTIGKQVARVRDLLAFAVREGWITSNPAAGMVKRHRGRSKREPYTPEDLRRVFGADFVQWEQSKRPARFWVPLLALYTGARRDELAQLLVADVREVAGVLVLDLNDEGEDGSDAGKSLKTEASRRKVPVHTQLIALGFREFVEARRLTGESRLFPDVKRNANGRWGDAVGKWFTRWRRDCGVTSKAQPMHALRNTVVTALLEAGVSRDVVKAVVGHEDDDITSGLYRAAPSPALMRAAVERLDWREPLAALFNRKRRPRG
jgi:integrase